MQKVGENPKKSGSSFLTKSGNCYTIYTRIYTRIEFYA